VGRPAPMSDAAIAELTAVFLRKNPS